MQRYFVTPEQLGESQVVLTGDDAHHIGRVMRMEAGDTIIISDGKERVAEAIISSVAVGRVEADISAWLPIDSEPRWSVTVAQSLPKGDKMELVIQKGTEIGAASFIPFQSERMIVQYDDKKEAKRLERWSKIAKEAAEQAHRSRIPAVESVMTWRKLIAALAAYDLALFCYEKEGGIGGAGLRDAVRAYRENQGKSEAEQLKVLLIVGPEGGFTEREAAEAEAAGAIIVGLGKRILRTETAAMVGLACLMYESGEMGGV
ncbi:ribosomal RNA small subunit methyltransferase E [Paenibacillus baekrokdamisoli]|uniref:Ribosomal RNA small subunit methyltransferase E n=1 Tax=Paenibacillus baekrokdamisoli TaxID=1712516 RepID=A0A3G9IR21_9BACL|nr:RsmE family RNA methyltransferase [Paenibacillus baekrokdamisoli]MBB3070305.1 16S rRNA (uracil1498-N3)-methyltransferase [Paenibacillus baekrokdamisoli]BBH21310.1 ribosomal RNA small subunit methyltransferase E [Paenibacillus baekrokdamisoli]